MDQRASKGGDTLKAGETWREVTPLQSVSQGEREEGALLGEEVEMPQYWEMTAYIDGLLETQDPEGNGTEKEPGGSTEGALLGYRWVAEEAWGQGANGPLQELLEDSMTGDRNESGIRGDNLLDWTVRDQAETSIDYDLGEIANRSFRDKYGIWAGQEEIFPVWGPGEPEGS